jgi:hypothetical protein
MYLALFLAPWMLMYALSTIVMNHRDYFRKSGPPPGLQVESEQTYAKAFPPGAPPRDIARQILADLRLEGTHMVNAPNGGKRIVILRQDPIKPRRITFTPSDGKLVIEAEAFRTPSFLERMHRRRHYQPGFFLHNAWSASVDFVILAMIFWAASGVWLWWTLKRTRLLGVIFAAAGCLVFGLFLFSI